MKRTIIFAIAVAAAFLAVGPAAAWANDDVAVETDTAVEEQTTVEDTTTTTETTSETTSEEVEESPDPDTDTDSSSCKYSDDCEPPCEGDECEPDCVDCPEECTDADGCEEEEEKCTEPGDCVEGEKDPPVTTKGGGALPFTGPEDIIIPLALGMLALVMALVLYQHAATRQAIANVARGSWVSGWGAVLDQLRAGRNKR